VDHLGVDPNSVLQSAFSKVTGGRGPQGQDGHLQAFDVQALLPWQVS
jgi:hypothetical protein